MMISAVEHSILQNKVKYIANEIASFLKIGLSEKDAYAYAKQLIKSDGQIEGIWHPIVIKFDESTLIKGVKYRPRDDIKLKNIAIIDLGLILEGIEIDYGITVSLNKKCHALLQSARSILNIAVKELEKSHHKYTPSGFYQFICEQTKKATLTQISESAGHSLGVFPTPKSKVKIRLNETAKDFSAYRAWMVEIHVSDGSYGAFFEDLVYLSE